MSTALHLLAMACCAPLAVVLVASPIATQYVYFNGPDWVREGSGQGIMFTCLLSMGMSGAYLYWIFSTIVCSGYNKPSK